MLRGHKLFCFNQWPLLYAVVQWNNCISHLILASAVLVFVDYIFNMAARSFLLKRLPWRYSVQSHSCWCGKGWSKKKYGWHPVWKFEKLAKFFFGLMQCVPFLSDWGVLIYNMVGTAVSSGDVWSSLDLLSSEIQNYLVTMSLYTDLLGSKSAMSEIYQVKGVICVNRVSRNTWLTLKVYFEIWQVLMNYFNFNSMVPIIIFFGRLNSFEMMFVDIWQFVSYEMKSLRKLIYMYKCKFLS